LVFSKFLPCATNQVKIKLANPYSLQTTAQVFVIPMKSNPPYFHSNKNAIIMISADHNGQFFIRRNIFFITVTLPVFSSSVLCVTA